MNDWREGARLAVESDHCPGCNKSGVLTWDFSKFGKHREVVCEDCNCIYVDGKHAATLERGDRP